MVSTEYVKDELREEEHTAWFNKKVARVRLENGKNGTQMCLNCSAITLILD